MAITVMNSSPFNIYKGQVVYRRKPSDEGFQTLAYFIYFILRRAANFCSRCREVENIPYDNWDVISHYWNDGARMQNICPKIRLHVSICFILKL